MAALIYQISWTKNLSYVYGTSMYAVGTVLSCFMTGLAIGSFVFGSHADKSPNPVRLFAYIEIGLGLSALLLIPIFSFLPQPYSLMHRTYEGSMLMNLMLFGLSFLVLIIPTSLIGGTFPVMNRIYTRRIKTVGKDVGVVYSIDTVFAAIGALMAGFVLLPLIGISKTIALAAIINILAGLYLHKISDEIDWSSYIKDKWKSGILINNGRRKLSKTDLNRTDRIVFLSFFLSGFAALTAEVVWIRFLSLILGTSTYALSIITASFLIGLSIGSWMISKYMHRIRYYITTFAYVELGIGLSAVLILLLVDKMDIPYLILYHTFNSYYPFTISLFIIIFLLMLIPTALMGATMPVVSKIISRKFKCIGTDIGVIFTSNTFGAIFGSFFASFILIPELGMTKTGALGAAISIIVAVMLFINSESKWRSKFYSLTGISVILCIYLASLTINPVFAGAYYHGAQLQDVESWKQSKSATELVHYEEGLYGLVSVVKQGDYIALRIDGKSESSNVPIELLTEYQLAYIPVFASSDPKDIMLIGLGGGFTLEPLTHFEEIQSIDVVEINPVLADITREHFSQYINYALDDPRVNLMIDDGRNHLAASDKQYDVIISQPSNIWLSGESGLFTKEMYEIVKARLNGDGIFGQWMPLYEQDVDDFKVFMATFESVFPYTNLWIVGYDAILVGSNEPIEYDYGNLRNHLSNNYEIKSDYELMSEVLSTQGRYGLIYQMAIPFKMSDRDIAEFSGSVINTDDHPILEFSTARNTMYPQNIEKPHEIIDNFLIDKYDLILTVPFTNLTIQYEDHIHLNFIDFEIGLDDAWKEGYAQIDVDHIKGAVYMQAMYARDSSLFTILAVPTPDQPITDSMKENVVYGMLNNAGPGLIEAKEISVYGYWGYEVITYSAAGDKYDYTVTWLCDDNDIIYNFEIRNVTITEGQEIIDSIVCFHEQI